MPLNDQSKFEKFLDFWPERFVNEFVRFYLWNARYPESYLRTLEHYKNSSNEFLSKFSNPKVENAREEFNKAFKKLFTFLSGHFGIPESNWIIHGKNADMFYLEPKLHHNFNRNITGASSSKWDDYKMELDEIATKFEETHMNFLKTAQKELSANDSVNGTNESRKRPVSSSKPSLKSIHLIAKTTAPSISDYIFLVLDGRFGEPIRAKAGYMSHETYLLKLYRIASPGILKFPYDGKLAENINNGLFRIVKVHEYMMAQNFGKPTVVKKSTENKMMLTDEVNVSAGIVTKDVPVEYRSRYRTR